MVSGGALDAAGRSVGLRITKCEREGGVVRVLTVEEVVRDIAATRRFVIWVVTIDFAAPFLFTDHC